MLAVLALTSGLLLPASPPASDACVTRRAAVVGSLAALLTPLSQPATAADTLGIEFRKLGSDDAERLAALSRAAEGELLPSGVRVIEMMRGRKDGAAPAEGTKVWLHFKLWTGSFDKGQPIDASDFDTRPIGYTVGSPTGRALPGIDEGIRGMREGGWRRLVVPASLGYGDEGWAGTLTKSRKWVKPGEQLYVDVRLMDGGSGKCEVLLGGKEAERLKSISCVRGSP